MNRPEQQLQRAVAQYVRLAYPTILWWHVPNAAKRGVVEGAMFKEMGVLAGTPDLHFVLPGGRIGFIEMKAGKGRLSDAQAAFGLAADQWGCQWAVCRSVEEVAAKLQHWYGPWGYNPRAKL